MFLDVPVFYQTNFLLADVFLYNWLEVKMLH